LTGGGGGSGSLSGGSSMALGTAATGSGTALGVSTGIRMGTVIRVGAGVGVGVGGFSRSKVMGARYCTTLRTVCMTGVDCSTSHSSATCKTPAVTTAGMDMRGRGS